MRKINAPILLTMLVFGATSLRAQATRTWVSGVGDDANPCSRTAPCKTFAGAISKTAAGGEIDALDPGGFGAVTITKSITIDGGGGQVTSILVSGTNGIVVSAGAGDIVTLKNLSFQGLGTGLNGIRVTSVGMLHVDHCHIQNFTQNGISIELGNAAGVDVFDTVSSDNTGSGFYAATTSGTVVVTINRSRLQDNNGAGVYAGNSASVSVMDSEASYNALGFIAQGNGGPATLNISNSIADYNSTVGIQAGGSSSTSKVRITDDSVFGNGTGLIVGQNGSIVSFGNNYNADGGSTPSVINPE